MKIYFDDTLIDPNGVIGLSQSEKLFENTFQLGSVVCRTVTLIIKKDYVPTTNPNTVFIKTEFGTKLFVLFIDSVTLEDDKNYVFKLTDGMVKFNVAYDWTQYSQATQVGMAVGLMAVDILGAEYGVVYFPNDAVRNYPTPPYEEGATARQLLSYVAEAMGCFVRIRDSGGLQFVKFNSINNKANINLNTCADIQIGDYHAIDAVSYGDTLNTQTIDIRLYDTITEGRYYQIVNEAGDDPRYSISAITVETDDASSVFKEDKITPNPVNSVDIVWNINGTTTTKTLSIAYPDNNVMNKIYNFRYDLQYNNSFSRKSRIIDLFDYEFNNDSLNGVRAYSFTLPEDALDDNEGFLKVGVTGEGEYDRFLNKAESATSEGIYIDGNTLYVLDPNEIFTDGHDFAYNVIPDGPVYLIYEIFQNEYYLQNGTSISSITTYPSDLIHSDYGILKFKANINRTADINDNYLLYIVAHYDNITDNIYHVNQNNPFFQDSATLQTRLDHLAENICGMEFFSFKTTRCQIAFRIPPDEPLRAGTIITFYSEDQEIPIISQNEFVYNTIWYGGYDSILDNKLQSETSYYGPSGSNQSINITQGANGTLTITE